MRKFQTILVILLLFTSLGYGQDVDPIEGMKNEISFGIASAFGEKVRENLAEAEMAQSDVDRIVQEFADYSAECFVGAVERQAKEQSLDADAILENLAAAFGQTSSLDVTSVLDRENLVHKLDHCMSVALENAGVPIK